MSQRKSNREVTMNDLVKTKKGNHEPKDKVYMGNTYETTKGGIIVPTAKHGGKIQDSSGKIIESNRTKEVAKLSMEAYEKEMEVQNARYEKLHQEVLDYNKSVPILDPRYSEDLVFSNAQMLVRLFLLPYIGDNGLVIRNQIELPNPSGHGQGKSVDDPFPYSLLGVVVNKDELIKEYTKGDIVQVHVDVAITQFAKHTNEFVLPKAFARWEDVAEQKPFDGYVLISPRDIMCKIQNYKF